MRVLIFALICLLASPVLSQTSEIDDLWRQSKTAIEAGDLRKAADLLARLNQKRVEFGFLELQSYSEYLIERGEARLAEGDREQAAFFQRKALELSPRSAIVLFKSIHLAQLTGQGGALDQLSRGLGALFDERELQLHVIESLIYPFLWALTIGLYVAMAFFIIVRLDWFLRGAARWSSPGRRLIIAPLAVLCLLALPGLAGPLWSLAVWSVAIYLFVPEGRRLGFFCGLLLGFWSTLIPHKYNLDLRLTEPGTKAIVTVSSGAYSPTDRARLEQHLARRSDDAVAWFCLAKVMRRNGDLVGAESALVKADVLWRGREPLIGAERGVIKFLEGKSREADELFQKAESAGMNSAPFYFNFSKIKFDLLDTEASRRYMERARESNEALTDQLKDNEERLTLRDPHAIGEMHLPLSTIFFGLFTPRQGVAEEHDRLVALLMPRATPTMMLMIGAFLMLWFLIVAGAKVRPKRSTLYTDYTTPRAIKFLAMLVPGAAWTLVDRPAFSAIMLTAAALIAMPLISWPAEAQRLLATVPFLQPLYIGFATIVFLGMVYVGYLVVEEQEL